MSTRPDTRPETRAFAERNARIEPFRVVELLERAKALEGQGRSVIHLEIGEPDFPTADPIIQAAHRALDAGSTKYTQALGLPELREVIARSYQTRAGVAVDPARVVVTAGASAGLLLLMGLLLGPGDELLLTDPGYPCNEVFVWLVNGVPVRVPLAPEHGFGLDTELLKSSWSPRTRGALVASPANPTGTMIPRHVLAQLCQLVREREGFLVLDEIYQGLVYADEVPYRSALEVADDIYVLNSFSKYFGMTGWRLGWMVLPEPAIEPVARLAQNLFICPPTLAQHAAIAAFSDAALAVHEARRHVFLERREVLVQGLESLGFRVPAKPDGAFYVYADIESTGLAAMDFCHRLLEQFAVATPPGIDFGVAHADHWVRFAFTTDTRNIRAALDRIHDALVAWGCR
ncbi:MAG: aminotransferase class I/II-fold pyridoxal phosphate-dependent enzyme [Gammaproteobacteria bacterium]